MKTPTIDGLRFRVPSGVRAHAVVKDRPATNGSDGHLQSIGASTVETRTIYGRTGSNRLGQAAACAVLAHDVLGPSRCGRRPTSRRSISRSARHVVRFAVFAPDGLVAPGSLIRSLTVEWLGGALPDAPPVEAPAHMERRATADASSSSFYLIVIPLNALLLVSLASATVFVPSVTTMMK